MNRKNINRRFLCVALATTAFSPLGGCGDGFATVTYAGATTLLPALIDAAEQFGFERPDIKVEISGGGTTQGIRAVARGDADLGGAARDLTADEQAKVWSVAYARDAIAVIANDTAVLEEVSLGALRIIYAAETGSPETRGLTRITKDWSHGTARAFAAGIGIDETLVRAEAVAGSNGKMLAMVQATKNAIGYVSWGEARAAIENGAPIRILSVNGVQPDLGSIQDGRYPLARILSLLLPKPGRGTTSPATKAFVKFLEGPKGAETLLRHGLSPILRSL